MVRDPPLISPTRLFIYRRETRTAITQSVKRSGAPERIFGYPIVYTRCLQQKDIYIKSVNFNYNGLSDCMDDHIQFFRNPT